MRILALILALTLPFGAIAETRVPMSEDPQLEWGLRVIAKGHFVRKYCSHVSIRLFRAYGLQRALVARANELGYSDDEIRAYFDDQDQKDRVEALARRDLEAKGVVWGDHQSFCDVARAEIEADRDFGHYFTYN